MGNTRVLPSQVIESLATRLAQTADLRLPAQLRRQEQVSTTASKQRYLAQLLQHDPGVFLERHGSSLTPAELEHFHCLRGDYEVDFYLKLLEDQQDGQKQSQQSKNRRLALMHRLEAGGAYFSEKEMRERQPGIYHQYIGQYRPPEQPQGPGEGCQGGNVLADSIMRQHEELAMRERQAEEQRQWEEAQRADESEEEEEEEGGTAAGAAAAASAVPQRPAAGALGAQREQPPSPGGEGALAGEEEAEAAAGPSFVQIPEEEQQENAAAFGDLMRQRFLAGQDANMDYAAIDADAELDDDWAVQAGRDAEDKYFDGGD